MLLILARLHDILWPILHI